MIKEKTVYCSTKTGKEYDSLVEAIMEDTAGDSSADDVRGLLQKFKSVKDEFYEALHNAKETSERELSGKIAEIHSRYDDILNQLAEQISRCGVNLSDDFQTGDGEALKRCPCRCVKAVKVRVARRF